MKLSKLLPLKKTINNSIDQQQQKENKSKTDIKNNEPICDICVQNVPGPEREQIFAIGTCDHSVCYVCSARLRAICDQQECPICRKKLDCVIFSASRGKTFDKHDTKSYIFNEKYKIYFENVFIQEAFDELLKFKCLQCFTKASPSKQSKRNFETDLAAKIFPDVSKLKDHLNYKHKLKLCDLCLKHNKLFPFEYSYYDGTALLEHMRTGKPKTSHTGHPNCGLCRQTFFNQDELLQHMSREHFHCHLCGRHNTTMHIYFLDYNSLRSHFKSGHFLCERQDCRFEQFTSAFDNEIDYQMHVVGVHGGSSNLSRGEARQQRTMTLDPASHREEDRRQGQPPSNSAVVSTGIPATANSTDPRRKIPEYIQQQIRQQRLPSKSEFPSLGHTAASTDIMTSTSSATVSSTPNSNQTRVVASNRNYAGAGPSNSRYSFVRSAGGGNRALESLDESDFPPLPEQPKSKGNKTKPKKLRANNGNEDLTLDQLIKSSLSLSTKNTVKSRSNNKQKNSKPKALKFQL